MCRVNPKKRRIGYLWENAHLLNYYAKPDRGGEWLRDTRGRGNDLVCTLAWWCSFADADPDAVWERAKSADFTEFGPATQRRIQARGRHEIASDNQMAAERQYSGRC